MKALEEELEEINEEEQRKQRIRDAVRDMNKEFEDQVKALNKVRAATDKYTDAQIKAIFGNKDYPSQGIYVDPETFDQTQVRRDEVSAYDFSITKYFYTGADAQNTINLTLSYQNRNNQSNSYWYDYNSGETTLTIGYQF